MSNYLVTNTELTSIADAIRLKGSTSDQLTFPNGFVTAIEQMRAGGYDELPNTSEWEENTFTMTKDYQISEFYELPYGYTLNTDGFVLHIMPSNESTPFTISGGIINIQSGGSMENGGFLTMNIDAQGIGGMSSINILSGGIFYNYGKLIINDGIVDMGIDGDLVNYGYINNTTLAGTSGTLRCGMSSMNDEGLLNFGVIENHSLIASTQQEGSTGGVLTQTDSTGSSMVGVIYNYGDFGDDNFSYDFNASSDQFNNMGGNILCSVDSYTD